MTAPQSLVFQRLTDPRRCFVIAELGSNHNGDNSLETNKVLLGGTGGTPVSLIG